jgi:lysyl-tRNA synthetase class 1
MADTYASWPFGEAELLKRRYPAPPPAGKPVTFETGFGPSGLPHIGTFAEVARTTWVRRAFEELSGWPTRLVAFSDDMDGLRKVPLNMPNREMLEEHLGEPLCRIPDPFGERESYSGYMNGKLREFLDGYGFDYQFQSSSEAYGRGDFDEGLSLLLARVEEVLAVITPTLGEEKRAGWSTFFPICERCGRVYSTTVTGYHPQENTIDYVCDQAVGKRAGCGHRATTSVFGGRVKVGWKVDWALRWYSYEVGYEMYGKDLIESARLSGRLLRIMGRQPPVGLFYELFLDEEGRKISKSVGKGLTVDAWVSYAPLESLLYYLFQNPKRAKRLYWDVVPKSVDDYLAELRAYGGLEEKRRLESAIWHIFDRGTRVPPFDTVVNYSLINNLLAALGSDDARLVLDFLERYDPKVRRMEAVVEDLVQRAIRYYRDFVVPSKRYRVPDAGERRMLGALRDLLAGTEATGEAELQALPFQAAKQFGVEPSDFFRMFYQVLLGQERGPRFGTLVSLLGREPMLALLERASDSTGTTRNQETGRQEP